MKLTPGDLRAAYDFLKKTAFKHDRLPAVSKVEFVLGVSRDPDEMGAYGKDGEGHVIWINPKHVRTVNKLLHVMAHEMLHLHLASHSEKCGDWHDTQFTEAARVIEHDLGWPKGSV